MPIFPWARARQMMKGNYTFIPPFLITRHAGSQETFLHSEGTGPVGQGSVKNVSMLRDGLVLASTV